MSCPEQTIQKDVGRLGLQCRWLDAVFLQHYLGPSPAFTHRTSITYSIITDQAYTNNMFQAVLTRVGE